MGKESANIYGSIQAALENGLDAIVDKCNANVEAQINAAVEAALANHSAPAAGTKQVNALTTTNDDL